MKRTKYILLVDIILQAILASTVVWNGLFFLFIHDISFVDTGFLLAFLLWFYQFIVSGLPNYYGRRHLVDKIKFARKIHLQVSLLVFILCLLILFTIPILFLVVGIPVLLILVVFSIYYFITSMQDYEMK